MKKLVILMLLVMFAPTASALFGKTPSNKSSTTTPTSVVKSKPVTITSSSSNNKIVTTQKVVITESKPVVKPGFFVKKPDPVIVSNNVTTTKPVASIQVPPPVVKPSTGVVKTNIPTNSIVPKPNTNVVATNTPVYSPTLIELEPYKYNNVKPIIQQPQIIVNTPIKPIKTFTPNYSITPPQYNQSYVQNNTIPPNRVIYVDESQPIVQPQQIIVVKQQPVVNTPQPIVIQQPTQSQIVQQPKPVSIVNKPVINTNNINDIKPVETKKTSYKWLWITLGLGTLGLGGYYGYRKYKEKLQNDFSDNFELQQESLTSPTKKVSKTYPELFFIGNSIKLDNTLKYQLDLTYLSVIPKELIVKDFDTIMVDGNEFERVLLEDSVNKEEYKILVDTKENKMYLFINYLQTENDGTSVIMDNKINFDTDEYNSLTDLIETRINNKDCYLRMYVNKDELLLLTAYPEYTNFDLGIELNKSHLS